MPGAIPRGVNLHPPRHAWVPRLLGVILLAAAHSRAENYENGARRIVISIQDHKLALIEGDHLLRIYDVAVGKRSTPTPLGTFEVVNRIPHPTWWGPRKVVPPGRLNPLGTRWLGLSVKGFGIHGTNAPESIGKHASHGCIRMRNQDVEELFELVTVGTTVELLDGLSEPFQRLLASAD